MKDGQNGKFMVGRGARRSILQELVTRRVRSAADCRQKRGFEPTACSRDADSHRFTRVHNRDNRCSVLIAVALC
jgi:hypothetical protein